MSTHAVPTNTDLDRLRAALTQKLRAPSGVRVAAPNGVATALEFVPDLSAAEQTTLAVLLSDNQAAPRLKAQYLTLRQWATDAQATFDAATAGSRALTAAEQREFIRRMGRLLDGMADLLLQQSLDS